MRGTRRIGLSLVVMILGLAQAEAEDLHLTKRVPSGQELVIYGHAGWNNTDCSPKEISEVHLEKAPEYGAVCARVANVTVRQIFRGDRNRCLGRTVRGVQVVYVAQSSYAGPDDFRYVVRSESLSWTVGVTIAVRAGPKGRRALPKDISEPVPGYVQPLGPIPPCTALVS
jgi:hypothetical protein